MRILVPLHFCQRLAYLNLKKKKTYGHDVLYITVYIFISQTSSEMEPMLIFHWLFVFSSVDCLFRSLSIHCIYLLLIHGI